MSFNESLELVESSSTDVLAHSRAATWVGFLSEGGGGGDGDESELALSCLECALVRKVLSLMFQLSDLLGTEASTLLHSLCLSECFSHRLTLTLLLHVLELLAA
ncbi:hypothetical protein LXL04_003993 [Taraxacum kok-saghyz]